MGEPALKASWLKLLENNNNNNNNLVKTLPRPTMRSDQSSSSNSKAIPLDHLTHYIDSQISEILRGDQKFLHRVPVLKLYETVRVLCVNGHGSAIYQLVVAKFKEFFTNDPGINEYMKQIVDINTNDTSDDQINLGKIFSEFDQEKFDSCCNVIRQFLLLFNYVFSKINVISLTLAYLDRNILVNSYSKLTIVELSNSLFFQRLFTETDGVACGQVILKNLLNLLHFNRFYQLNKHLEINNFDALLPVKISVSASNDIDPEKLLVNSLIILKKIDLIISNLDYYRNISTEISCLTAKAINFNKLYIDELNRFTTYVTETLLVDTKEGKVFIHHFISIFEKLYQHENILIKLIYNNKDMKSELRVLMPSCHLGQKIYFQFLHQYYQYGLFSIHANFIVDDNAKVLSLVDKTLLFKLIVNNNTSLPSILNNLITNLNYEDLKKLYELHCQFDKIPVLLNSNFMMDLNNDEDTDIEDSYGSDDEDKIMKVPRTPSDLGSTQQHKTIESFVEIWGSIIQTQLKTTFINFKKKLNKRDLFGNNNNNRTGSIIEVLYNLKLGYFNIVKESFKGNHKFLEEIDKAFIKISSINKYELINELVKYCDSLITSMYSTYINPNKPFISCFNEDIVTKILPNFTPIYWFFLKFLEERRFEVFIGCYKNYLSRRLLNMNNLLESESLNKKLVIEKIILILFTKDFGHQKDPDNDEIMVKFQDWNRNLKMISHFLYEKYTENDTEFGTIDMTHISKPRNLDLLKHIDGYSSIITDDATGVKYYDGMQLVIESNNEKFIEVDELLSKFRRVYSMITDLETSRKYLVDFSQQMNKFPTVKSGKEIEFDPVVLSKKSWPNFNNNNFGIELPQKAPHAEDDHNHYSMPELFDAFNELFFLQTNKIVSFHESMPANSDKVPYDKQSRIYSCSDHKSLNWNYSLHYLVLDFHLTETQTVTIQTVFVIGCILLMFNDATTISYESVLSRLKLKKNSAVGKANMINGETLAQNIKSKAPKYSSSNKFLIMESKSKPPPAIASFSSSSGIGGQDTIISDSMNSSTTVPINISSVITGEAFLSALPHDPDDLVKRSIYSLQRSGVIIKCNPETQNPDSTASISGKFDSHGSFMINENLQTDSEGEHTVLRIPLVSSKNLKKSST